MNEMEMKKQLIDEDEDLKNLFKELIKAEWQLEIERMKQQTFEMKRKMEEYLAINQKTNKTMKEEF